MSFENTFQNHTQTEANVVMKVIHGTNNIMSRNLYSHRLSSEMPLPEAVVVKVAVAGHCDHAAPRQVSRVEQLRRSRKPYLNRNGQAEINNTLAHALQI